MQMPFIGRKRRFSSHPAGSEQPQRIYHRNSQYAEHHSGRCFYAQIPFRLISVSQNLIAITPSKNPTIKAPESPINILERFPNKLIKKKGIRQQSTPRTSKHTRYVHNNKTKYRKKYNRSWPFPNTNHRFHRSD